MLSKPSCGWVNVSIGEFTFPSASYLTDVPADMLSMFHDWVVDGKGSVHLDFEGHGTADVELEDTTFTIRMDSMDEPVCLIFDSTAIYKMIVGLSRDIDENLESMLAWHVEQYDMDEFDESIGEFLYLVNLIKDDLDRAGKDCTYCESMVNAINNGDVVYRVRDITAY